MLVGGFNPSEKYEFVSWDDAVPNLWKHKSCSKPPTKVACNPNRIPLDSMGNQATGGVSAVESQSRVEHHLLRETAGRSVDVVGYTVYHLDRKKHVHQVGLPI